MSFSACKNDDIEEGTLVDSDAVLKTAIVVNYVDVVYASYEDSYNEAVKLQNAITVFLANPESETNFEAAKQAWLNAREPYGQTEAFRFSNGPIDDEDGPEGWLNAWPLDEAYIDYVTGDATAGIINDPINYPSISKTLLVSLNENGKDDNISVGYHAIEFLLWGQDAEIPTPERNKGLRPRTDFIKDGTATNQERRAEYLKVCAELLVDHLKLMVDEWKPSGAYRTAILNKPSDEVLANMISSIGILSKAELAGERIFVAYNNESQEDEHSCFSDNTHRDIILNAQGISNVYKGEYTRVNGSVVSGASLSQLVTLKQPALGAEITSLLANVLAKTKNIGEPFDYAITPASGKRQGVYDAAVILQLLGTKFTQAGSALGLTVTADFKE